jgi:aspartyl-tRNA(Asn)/glutamyl-tRNA(Gln) amidotransferase subunit B
MEGKYIPVIGFEVHLQPKTKSKMFCSCSANYFGQKPNINSCPVCLGLPGALPVPNKLALDKCILVSLALNCKINQETKFDRKNYFYPDLPKAYQISQYDKPIGYEGFVEFDIDGDSRRIRITRVHMEEDTAKSMHEKDRTLIDFNKSGLPLIEIVTEPDFQTLEEVDKFAKRLRQIIRYLGISDADMEKGQMRYELNMSLKKPGEQGLPNYKVEVKNIASISALQKVMEYEYKRQSELLDKGETPVQETRGIRDLTGETYSQRSKEGAEDYRYFPEPDIPPIEISNEWIEEISSKLIELPQNRKDRYIADYSIDPDSAEVLVSTKSRMEFFEKCLLSMSKDVDIKKHAREVAKWIIGDLGSLMKASKTKFSELKIEPTDIIEIVARLDGGKITGSIAKQVLKEAFETGQGVEKIIAEKGLEVVSDTGVIEKMVDEVVQANQKAVETLDKNPNAIKFLVGQVMRISQGKASPQMAEEILKKKLLSNING